MVTKRKACRKCPSCTLFCWASKRRAQGSPDEQTRLGDPPSKPKEAGETRSSNTERGAAVLVDCGPLPDRAECKAATDVPTTAARPSPASMPAGRTGRGKAGWGAPASARAPQGQGGACGPLPKEKWEESPHLQQQGTQGWGGGLGSHWLTTGQGECHFLRRSL